MKTKQSLVLVVLMLFFAGFLRFYQLDKVPSALYYDEVDLSYQARSLIETGKDYRGHQSLFYKLTFNDPKAPLPIILSIPATIIFKSEELQVRATPAFMGVIVTLLAFLITKLITKNFWASFLTGLVFATNPWQLQFSRWAVEGIFSIAFYMASFYLFLKAFDKNKFLYLVLSIIFFSLTVYIYRTMSLFIPLTLIILLLIYRKNLLKFGLQKLGVCVMLATIIILPFLYFTTIKAPDVPRIAQVSVTSNSLISILVQRDREVDSNDFGDPTIGKTASITSYFFHNKILSYSKIIFDNYLKTFSTDFLFLSGALNIRESIGQLGELFYIDIIAIVFGFAFVIKNIKQKKGSIVNKHFLYILVLFLITPIPSSLTNDGAKHGSRLFIFSVPLLLILGLGWWQLISFIKKLKYSKVFYLFFILAWLLCFIFYSHRYLVDYPVESAREFGYGFKQVSKEIGSLSPKYKYIYISPSNDPPMIYILFWNHISPIQLQEYGSKFDVGQDLGKPLDKYKVVDLFIGNTQAQESMGDILQKNILYVFGAKDIHDQIHDKNKPPKGVNIIDIIKYPNNESAFYLMEKI